MPATCCVDGVSFPAFKRGATVGGGASALSDGSVGDVLGTVVQLPVLGVGGGLYFTVGISGTLPTISYPFAVSGIGGGGSGYVTLDVVYGF